MKEQDKITSRGLNKTVISSMPAREFKAMVIHSLYLRREWRMSVRPSTKRSKT